LGWRSIAGPYLGRNDWIGILMDTEFESPDFAQYKCYKIRGVLYIPHYVKPGVYVAPSIKTTNAFGRHDFSARYFYKHELLAMGASEIMETLWKTSARDSK
jgi:hypothetical protein